MAARGPKSDKFWSDAVRLAAFRECESDPERRKYINVVAENLVKQAAEGDMAAIVEMGNRIDGRPQQATDVNVEMTDRTGALAAFAAALARAARPDDD